MPVWWVTGATGFLGQHVLSHLARRIHEHQSTEGDEASRIVALVRRDSPLGIHSGGIEHVRLASGTEDDLRRAAEQAPPDYVIHCAGQTPPAAENELRRANVEMTVNLLAALRHLARPVRMVVAGSAAELGPVDADVLPVAEDYPCRPVDTYGRIKWEASRLVLEQLHPLEPIVARIFNPIGPGLSSKQAFGRFASQLLSSTSDPLTLRVGNLDARRDFVDIRDVANAMITLAMAGRSRTVYHIGTGQSRRVGDGLNTLIRLSGRAIRLEIDADLGNTRGPSDSRADIRRITRETGWEPKIPWEKSLTDLWNEAKARAECLRPVGR